MKNKKSLFGFISIIMTCLLFAFTSYAQTSTISVKKQTSIEIAYIIPVYFEQQTIDTNQDFHAAMQENYLNSITSSVTNNNNELLLRPIEKTYICNYYRAPKDFTPGISYSNSTNTSNIEDDDWYRSDIFKNSICNISGSHNTEEEDWCNNILTQLRYII